MLSIRVPSATGHYLPSLQYIRGLAALGVAYVHAVQLLPGSEASSFFGAIYPLTYFGAAGVDMFFILSGFLMFHLRETYTARGRMRFLLERAIRIIPVYWICTLLFAALLVLGGEPESAPSLIQLAASLTFIPVLNNAGSYQPVLNVGWSLNYELVFYILFAAVLSLKSDWRRLVLLVMPISILVNLHYQFYLFEFLLGGIVCIVHNYKTSRDPSIFVGTSRKSFLVWFGILLIALLMLATSYDVYRHGGLLRFFAWGVAGAFLLYLVLGLPNVDGTNITTLSSIKRCLNWLGEISYSLYLTHWIVGIVLHKLLANSSLNLPISLRICVVFLFSIVFGHIFHRIVDLPLDRWLRKKLLGYRFLRPAEDNRLASAVHKYFS